MMSTGQTHLSEGNFPINLDNIPSICEKIEGPQPG